MIIRNYPKVTRRGNKLPAQGDALGKVRHNNRPERAKASLGSDAFALSGRMSHGGHTQSDAQG